RFIPASAVLRTEGVSLPPVAGVWPGAGRCAESFEEETERLALLVRGAVAQFDATWGHLLFESDPGGGFSSPCQFWFGERVPRPNLRLAKEIFMVKESLLRLCKDPNLESAVSIRDPGSTLFILLRSHFRGSGLLELNRNVIQEPFGETDLRRAIDFVTLYQSLSLGEAKWLMETRPVTMLLELADRLSQRKLRLLACALCRRLLHLHQDSRSEEALDVAERFADG